MGWDDHNDNSFEGQNFNSSNLKTNEALMEALMCVRVRGSENVTWPRSHVEMRYLWGSEWIEPLHGSIVCDHAVHAVHVEHHLTQRCNETADVTENCFNQITHIYRTIKKQNALGKHTTTKPCVDLIS